jgi:hypothetical protein
VNLVDEGAQRAGTTIESQVEYVDRMPNRKGRPGDLNFRAMPAHAQSRYAAALEKMSKKDIEPLFGQTAQAEWDAAHKEWIDFGSYPFPTYNYPEQLVRLDDATNLEKYHSAELNDNQRYWTSRWSEQMNYKYWKDRCDAERQAQGVEARRLFYEGTLALRNGDFQEAVGRYKQGLELWKDLLDRYTIYRNDDLNQKDTGELVRRYVYALRQVGESPPDDMPFRDLYEAVKSEPFRDPFDQLDMMKVSKDSGSSSSP